MTDAQLLLCLAVIGTFLGRSNPAVPCQARHFEHDSFVCVCNATYCDYAEELGERQQGRFQVYTTSKSQQRLERTTGDFVEVQTADVVNVTITIDPSKPKQSIFGFGGCFTDSAGYNINNLSPGAADNLMASYFTTEGLGYNMGRVPIAGTDFSLRPYTYDDNATDDFQLEHFALQQEDFDYKIPKIKTAKGLCNCDLKLIASPWSAPAWMKTIEQINGGGSLKGPVGGQYYETWANYYIKFLQSYRDNGIDFWAVTTQNEPFCNQMPFFPFNSMGYTPENLAIFGLQNLKPTLLASEFANVEMLAYDDSRATVARYMEKMYADDRSEDFVFGTALHWYFDALIPPSVIDDVHNMKPDKPILMTEAVFVLDLFDLPIVQLGGWNRGHVYATRMIENFNHWVASWIDWSLVTDIEGGPVWDNIPMDGTIMVNKDNDEFFKQPVYYAIGHFSKFLAPGSTVLTTNVSTTATLAGISAVAFRTPTESTVLVTTNSNGNIVPVVLKVVGSGTYRLDIPANSIQTYIW